MANKKKDEALMTVSPLEGLVTFERPGGADAGVLGNEHIGRDDILTPRLGLAQKMSPELDSTNQRFIEGLQFTDLFNSLSRKSYGKGPLYFAVLRADPPRWVEFNPLEQGGGVRDPSVPANDPRTQFGPRDPITGKGAKPVATKFYDFIVLVLNDLDVEDPLANVVGLSLKSTGLKVAKHLNLLINQRGKKFLYKGAYELRSAPDSNVNGTFAIYKVNNAGWLTPGTPIEKLAAELFEAWKDREVKIDLEGAHIDEGDDESFAPADFDKDGAAATTDM